MASVDASRRQVGAELLFRTSGGRSGTPPAERIASQRQLATQHLRRPVQQKLGGPERSSADAESTHASAERGVSGPASALPHMDSIQRAFGRHDVSQIEAHVGSEADAATQEMGAKAYASGNQVALGSGGTDLHTVAHEAAHVVQQRGGVQLAGGVGRDGDAHEQHADAVADRVVKGQSAEALLDRAAKGGAAKGGSPAADVQRKPLGGAPVQLAKPGNKAAAQALLGGVVAKKPPKLKKGERAGGFPFGNYQKVLDQQDKNGKAITYTEYDVNAYDGVKRDAERIVVGSDGRCWYTSNHYTSFTEVK